MIIDREDYLKRANEASEARQRDRIPQLEMVMQAAVKAEYLTGEEHWDLFLSYLQGTIERAKAIKATHESSLADPRIVNADALMAVKLALVECDAVIRSLESVIELPRTLLENGEHAKDLIERIGLADETTDDERSDGRE